MAKKWHKQIYDYFNTFFSMIREFTEKEPEYRDYIPDLFKFPYIVISFKCIDGYVVAAYPSGIADNYIHIDQDRKVDGVLHSLPNKILGTSNNFEISVNNWGGSGRLEIVSDRVETKRGPLPTTGWKFLHIATKDHKWLIKKARKAANEFIAIFKARAALYDVPSGGGFIQNFDRVVLRHELTNRLHQILDQYKSIINEQNFNERIIHKYLRDHPVLLFPTKKRLLYEYPLIEDGKLVYQIDFIVELTTGRYILVELENPKHLIFTKSGDYRAIVNHAERQVEDWIRFLRKNREIVEDDLLGLIAPEGIVVIGRSDTFTSDQRESIRIHNEKHSIKLYTYDDLAEEAQNHISHLFDI